MLVKVMAPPREPVPPPPPNPEPTPTPNNKHELRVMGKKGDEKVTWDSDDQKQVLKARTAFEEYKKKGYKLYKTETIGGKKTGEPIDEFDPNIERMIAVPPMQGGASEKNAG